MPRRPRFGRLEWDERAARYRNPTTGRFVDQRTVRADIDAALAEAKAEIRGLGQQLRERRISVRKWEAQMRQAVKRLHVWSAAAAKGGRAQLTQADYGRIGQRVREQYAYLRARARAVASGRQARDGTLTTRAGMYADAGRATFEATRRAEEAIRGATEERSIRHAHDSCSTEDGVMGCREAEAKGWQPIGTLPLPGDRVCITNCHCEMEYRAA